MKKTKDIQTFLQTIDFSKFILKRVWHEKAGKKYICIKLFITLVNTIIPLVYSIIPGLIVNELLDGAYSDVLIVYVAILSLSPVLLAFLNNILDSLLYKLRLDLELIFAIQFQKYITIMDYETIENPDIQIKKDRAQITIDNTIVLIDKYVGFFASIIKIIVIFSIIATLNIGIVALIMILLCINSLLTKKVNQKMYQIGLELSKHDRGLWGIIYMLEQPCYAKEIRLFNLSTLLTGEYGKRIKAKNKLEIRQFKIGRKIGIYGALGNFVQQVLVYSYAISSVLAGKLALGSMTIYIGMISQFSGSIKSLFDGYLNIAKDNYNIQELKDFLNIPCVQYRSGDKTPSFDKDSIIEFRNVSFKYPGSNNYTLKDFNLTIRGNEKLCIVGCNGAGKSTFIKLLARLYMVDKGEILLNGTNINEYDYTEYQRLFAPVFQDYVRYYFSLGTNIVLASQFDKDKLDKICQECGLTDLVNKLPKGYDTQVDKFIDEEGFEPSGGEDQRIAIARACYKGGEIYLLDEPTAAIDPMAEYEIYTQFNNMTKNKCAILITHRLSTVQLADKVAVFDNGSVVEYGTHKELYEKGGMYTEMFDKQAQFYRDDPNDAAADCHRNGPAGP